MTIDEIKKDIRDILNDVTEIDTDAVGDDDLLFGFCRLRPAPPGFPA